MSSGCLQSPDVMSGLEACQALQAALRAVGGRFATGGRALRARWARRRRAKLAHPSRKRPAYDARSASPPRRASAAPTARAASRLGWIEAVPVTAHLDRPVALRRERVEYVLIGRRVEAVTRLP